MCVCVFAFLFVCLCWKYEGYPFSLFPLNGIRVYILLHATTARLKARAVLRRAVARTSRGRSTIKYKFVPLNISGKRVRSSSGDRSDGQKSIFQKSNLVGSVLSY